MATFYKPAPELTDQQKLDLIRGTQERIQKALGINPDKPLADNIEHMRNHPDAEIRRRYGNLGTAPSTVDPVTRQRGLGEQAEFVAFALRDFTAEAEKIDPYARSKFLTDKLQRAQGLDDWMAPLKPGQVWRDDVDTEATRKVAQMEETRTHQEETHETPDTRADRMIKQLGTSPSGQGSFLSREEFMALTSDRQIKAINDLETRASVMKKDPKIEAQSYAGRRLTSVSETPTSTADLEQVPAADRPAQAYRHYYAAQEALEWGDKVLTGKDPKAGSAPALATSLGGSHAKSQTVGDGQDDDNAPDVANAEPATKKQGSQQRLERLTRLQERTERALGSEKSNSWTADQKRLAESFVQRDLANDLQNPSLRRELRGEIQAIRTVMKTARAEREAPDTETVTKNSSQPTTSQAHQGTDRQQRRSPEERMERLERLQDRVATALAEGSGRGWSDEQKQKAQRFVQTDLTVLKDGDRAARRDIALQAREMREILRNNRIAPDETLAPRIIDRQEIQASQTKSPVSDRPSSENRDGRADRREQRLERLEALQTRVREAREQGVTDGWSSEQQNLAATFAIRNLRTDLQNGQRDAIHSEVQALRPLLKGQDANRDAGIQPRAAFASSWNDKTRFPEAEPPAYAGPGFTVEIRPGGPSWNGSPGFGDRTEIPETKTASYDVSIRRSSQPSFSAAAAVSPRPPAPPRPVYEAPAVQEVQQPGGYASRNVDNGITWSGGRLTPRFGHAVQDPGPPPGWPGRTPGYEEPSSPLGGLLQGAAAFAAHKHAGDMDWDNRRDLRQGLRAAGFDPRNPIGNAAASITGPLFKGLGL
jgi:hypothetical protein